MRVTNTVVGLAGIGIGLVLLAMAFHSTQAPIEKLSETLTGRFSDETMAYFTAGLFASVAGGFLVVLGYRR